MRNSAPLWRRMLSTGLEDAVLQTRAGSCATVRLNRAKKLNSLNEEMICTLRSAFRGFHADPDLTCIIVRGEGDRAFCAGGDVVAVRSAGLEGATGGRPGAGHASDFFRAEYEFNNLVATCSAAQVSFWHGVVMGGGVGASAHGPVRVASERTLFAMPETAIGLFPDVGASYWLPRLPQGPSLGLWIGLTGARLGAADLMVCGIATHFCPEAHLDGLAAALQDASAGTTQTHAHRVIGEKAQEFIDGLGDAGAPPSFTDSEMYAQLPFIFEAFHPAYEAGKEALEEKGGGHGGVAAVEALRGKLGDMAGGAGDRGAWAQKTLGVLDGASPTSLAVSAEAMLFGERFESVADCLKMEFRLVNRCVAPDSDFFEGVRALLVDKDRDPRWKPAPSAEQVKRFFEPLPEGVEELSL